MPQAQIQRNNKMMKTIIKILFTLKSKDKISYNALKIKLLRRFPGCQIYITDRVTTLLNRKDIPKIKAINFFKFRKWVAESYDCDNFAFSLKGLVSAIWGNHAFGVVFVKRGSLGAHALNCFIDERGIFTYFEPQTNKTFSYHGGYKPYLIII